MTEPLQRVPPGEFRTPSKPGAPGFVTPSLSFISVSWIHQQAIHHSFDGFDGLLSLNRPASSPPEMGRLLKLAKAYG